MSKTKDQRSLEDVLRDISDILFPAEESPPPITLTTAASDGDTALHAYLWRKDPHAVRVLLDAGANPNAIGDMGETPLHVSVRDASPETIAAILAAGAREDIISEFGQTPLQLAQSLERESVYREAKRIAHDLKQAQRPGATRDGGAREV